MSKIHFTVRYFIRGKMNRIRKVEKIKGTHLRYLCCEASHCRFALSVDGKALSMGFGRSLVHRPFLRSSVLPNRQCCPTALSAPFLRASERCPPSIPALRSSVPQSAVHCQHPLRSSVPQSVVHRQSPICFFRASE